MVDGGAVEGQDGVARCREKWWMVALLRVKMELLGAEEIWWMVALLRVEKELSVEEI